MITDKKAAELILVHFFRRGTAGAQPFPAGERAPADPGLVPPLFRLFRFRNCRRRIFKDRSLLAPTMSSQARRRRAVAPRSSTDVVDGGAFPASVDGRNSSKVGRNWC